MILIVNKIPGSNNFHIVIASSQTKIHLYVYLFYRMHASLMMADCKGRNM